MTSSVYFILKLNWSASVGHLFQVKFRFLDFNSEVVEDILV